MMLSLEASTTLKALRQTWVTDEGYIYIHKGFKKERGLGEIEEGAQGHRDRRQNFLPSLLVQPGLETVRGLPSNPRTETVS